ncbi:endo-1,4-beta-xylanase [Capsulimonas corticalis]|uniref:Endo-1,4-beta-xylanase n=1 Tax=Capsulimonas corticalis TaxID=2219043 RepID=A0A402D2N4_9BACT|nr:family 43 glycosylhydrolase [Capsulimonas corticalis]BDI28444.1 endo-1,4-beta-xylanase [Capsulimonas corticalis]
MTTIDDFHNTLRINPLPFAYNVDGAASHTELRDPCITREGDTYYLVFTVWPFAGRIVERMGLPDNGSSPGIALYSSKDLKDWAFVTWLVKSSDLAEDCPYKHRFWAPEIHKIHGRFYLIFTADNWNKLEYNPAGEWCDSGYAFVGVADEITGPYEHITYIHGACCDTSLFEDSDGRTYALIPRMNVDVQEIDLTQIDRDIVTLLGKPETVITADNSDIGFAPRPDYLEAPWVFQANGRYYFLSSGPYKADKFPDHAGYWAGVAYADNIRGPWRKDPRGQVFLGGHMAVFQGPDGQDWFAYRGEMEDDKRTHGRLCVDPIQFEVDGRFAAMTPTAGAAKNGDDQ